MGLGWNWLRYKMKSFSISGDELLDCSLSFLVSWVGVRLSLLGTSAIN
jgi:hypothetical protein